MAFARQTQDPMEFARRAGREKIIADVIQNLKLQQAQFPGEAEEYGRKKQAVDIGSNFATNALMKLLQTVTAPATGGASLAVPTILEQILEKAGTGTAKSLFSKGLSDAASRFLNIKAPKAPTVDMSKLTGSGMSGARKTIADALSLSDVGYKSSMEGLDKSGTLMNLLMSFGPELKEPIEGLGGEGQAMNIYDYLKDIMGLGSRKGGGSTVFSMSDKYPSL